MSLKVNHNNPTVIHLKSFGRAGEIVQRLRALVAFPAWILTSQWQFTIVCNDIPGESSALFWPLQAPGMHTVH